VLSFEVGFDLSINPSDPDVFANLGRSESVKLMSLKA